MVWMGCSGVAENVLTQREPEHFNEILRADMKHDSDLEDSLRHDKGQPECIWEEKIAIMTAPLVNQSNAVEPQIDVFNHIVQDEEDKYPTSQR